MWQCHCRGAARRGDREAAATRDPVKPKHEDKELNRNPEYAHISLSPIQTHTRVTMKGPLLFQAAGLSFGVTLIAIATLHGQALPVALSGMALTVACKLLALGPAGAGSWLLAHVGHEWFRPWLVGRRRSFQSVSRSAVSWCLAQPGLVGRPGLRRRLLRVAVRVSDGSRLDPRIGPVRRSAFGGV